MGAPVDAPGIELTQEEKQMWYRKLAVPDLTDRVLAKAYTNFSWPKADEGFDDILHPWRSEADCAKLLSDWIYQQKMTQRVEDLEPGEWFKENLSKWQKALQEWRRRQSEHKDPQKRKAYLQKKMDEAKKKREEAKGEGNEGEKNDEQPEEAAVDINPEDVDVFAVEDVSDLGNGEPLFYNFAYEDWALLSARTELHLLLHAFRKDLNDSDRPSFGEKHLAFYYNKYFKKTFSLKNFSVEQMEDFVELVKDTITQDKDLFKAVLEEETSYGHFVKLTEEHRRDRQRREDAGDESAKLAFPRPAPPASRPPPPAGSQGQGSSQGSGRGSSSYPSSRPSQPPPSRYSSSRPSYGGDRNGGGYGGGGSSNAGQKRPYTSSAPPPPPYSNKQSRSTYYDSSRPSSGGGGYRR